MLASLTFSLDAKRKLVAGNRDALALIQYMLRSQTQHWLIEDPTYPPIEAALNQNSLHRLPVSPEGCSAPEQLTNWAAILTPNRQYPLGFSYSSPNREAWLAAAVAQQGFIIEDDYDNEFLYQGTPNAPLSQTAQLRGEASERVFYIGSFSKVLFRSLRLGFIVTPLKHAAAIRNSQQALGGAAALPIQPALADFMENGHFYRHLNRMRRLYRQKRDDLLILLEQELSSWFTWEKPKGGMHIIAYIKAPYDHTNWCHTVNQHCETQALRLSWLQHHYAASDQALLGLVLGFTAPSLGQLKQWVQTLRQACIQASINFKQ